VIFSSGTSGLHPVSKSLILLNNRNHRKYRKYIEPLEIFPRICIVEVIGAGKRNRMPGITSGTSGTSGNALNWCEINEGEGVCRSL